MDNFYLSFGRNHSRNGSEWINFLIIRFILARSSTIDEILKTHRHQKRRKPNYSYATSVVRKTDHNDQLNENRRSIKVVLVFSGCREKYSIRFRRHLLVLLNSFSFVFQSISERCTTFSLQFCKLLLLQIIILIVKLLRCTAFEPGAYFAKSFQSWSASQREDPSEISIFSLFDWSGWLFIVWQLKQMPIRMLKVENY